MPIKSNASLKCSERKLPFSRAGLLKTSFLYLQFSKSLTIKSNSIYPNYIYRGDFICKKYEEIDFFGIILHGQTFISLDHVKVQTLGIGDMIGFMQLSEFISSKEGSKHKYDIIAETDGIIAMLPFGEIKSESRKNP